ncbi:SCY1-like protein 2 isoform X4 [Dermacentor albipictus]|uniref:SCY1-like protein 2 isoform X4 n=1 Tax=Dermacentor albipictus TaxID=60249 RepID=UPI0038FC41F7
MQRATQRESPDEYNLASPPVVRRKRDGRQSAPYAAAPESSNDAASASAAPSRATAASAQASSASSAPPASGPGPSGPQLRARPATPLEANPISQFYEIGRQTASAGPELIWKIYDAQRKSDKREASVFVFEKRVAEKLHKPKRKETVTEILRFSVRQLDRFKHPKLLTIYHPIEEASETLAFATEPVLGSLANILNCLEDRLPQCLPHEIRDYQFLDIEIKYGLLQLTEALSFLHYSCKLIHRNLCPQSVIVNKRGTWKLAGLEFTEKCSDTDLLSPVSCQSFTSKLPKMGQPDLDYTAPEIQATSTCSPLSDMFSLGLVICALFNNGHSIIEGNLSTTTYNKQLEVLEGSLHNLLDRVPHHLQEPLQGLLQVDPRRRPNAQNFSMIKYFMDPAVHGLQYLDVIQMKDSTHKSHFYHNLKTALPNIPKKLWWQHVLPSLKMELQSPEVLAAALQPLLFIIEESTVDEYQTIILPIFRSVFGMPKSVQATVTLLENLDVLMKKTPKTDIKADVLPMLYNSFDSTTPQIQCAAMHAIAQIADYLEESAVRKMVLPRTKQVFENNSGIKVQANALICIEKIIDKLEKTDILDEVLPMLGKAKLQDPAILMPVVRIYKHMLSDKRYGLTVNLLATKVMPALIPVVVSPALKLDQFTSLIELLQEMLEHVSKSQRNKLKLEKLSIPSTDMLPVQTPYNMEQPTGYPHRPPSLRLESRRTSISMDDVVRRTCSSASSSPDSNLLRVQATLPGRRHSDNTIQPPRILVAPCSPEGTVSYTPGGLPVRRHSSVGTQDSRFSGFFSSPKMASPNLGVDFFSSSRANVRRYSAAAVCGAAGLPNAANQASSFLQQIGSGVTPDILVNWDKTGDF